MNTTRRILTTAAIAPVLAAGALFAGCGDDGSGDNSRAAAGASSKSVAVGNSAPKPSVEDGLRKELLSGMANSDDPAAQAPVGRACITDWVDTLTTDELRILIDEQSRPDEPLGPAAEPIVKGYYMSVWGCLSRTPEGAPVLRDDYETMLRAGAPGAEVECYIAGLRTAFTLEEFAKYISDEADGRTLDPEMQSRFTMVVSTCFPDGLPNGGSGLTPSPETDPAPVPEIDGDLQAV